MHQHFISNPRVSTALPPCSIIVAKAPQLYIDVVEGQWSLREITAQAENDLL
jgi:hypothetical protein